MTISVRAVLSLPKNMTTYLRTSYAPGPGGRILRADACVIRVDECGGCHAVAMHRGAGSTRVMAGGGSCQLPGYPGPLRLFSKFSFKIPSAATLRWQRSFSCRERVAVPVRDVHAATPRRHSKLRGTCPAAIRCVRRQSPVCTDACGRIQPSAGPAVRPRWRSPVVSPNVWGAEPEPVRTAAALSPYGLHAAAVPAAVSAAVPNLVPESPAGQSVPLCSDTGSWSAAVPALQV